MSQRRQFQGPCPHADKDGTDREGVRCLQCKLWENLLLGTILDYSYVVLYSAALV